MWKILVLSMPFSARVRMSTGKSDPCLQRHTLRNSVERLELSIFGSERKSKHNEVLGRTRSCVSRRQQ